MGSCLSCNLGFSWVVRWPEKKPSHIIVLPSEPELNKYTQIHHPYAEKETSMVYKYEPTAAPAFTYGELADATMNFNAEHCLLGEGGFGRVYRGVLLRSKQVVAIKQLNPNGLQGNTEFFAEFLMLSLVRHPNLVNFIGYCADGDQRLLVYEYLPLGSLDNHLYDIAPKQKILDWNTRMKIAAGAARGLEYLHKLNPPIIFRDLKPANILLGRDYRAKLSDFGLAKLLPEGDKGHVSTRVMGTNGYCAPEYMTSGHLTVKADIFSFGVVLLEIISGRKAFDGPENGASPLLNWARPLFKKTQNYLELADPRLRQQYPERGFNRAVSLIALCVQEKAEMRPSISDIARVLNSLATPTGG